MKNRLLQLLLLISYFVASSAFMCSKEDSTPAPAPEFTSLIGYWKVKRGNAYGIKEKGEKKYVVAIDGRTLCSRSEHSLVNLLFQSCGAIAMDLALCLFDKHLGKNSLDEKGLPTYHYKGYKVRRVGYFHDELQVECAPEIADEIGTLIVSCIKQAGDMLKLRVPLDGEYKIADNWAGTH